MRKTLFSSGQPSLRLQLLFMFTIIIMFTAMTVTFVLSRNTYLTIKERALSDFDTINRQIAVNLDDTLNTIDDYYYFILSNRQLFKLLQTESFGLDPASYDSVLYLKDILFSLISITDGLESAFYISTDKVLVSSLSGVISPQIIDPDYFFDQPFIDEIRKNPQLPRWSSKDLDRDKFLYYVRAIQNPSDGEILGYLCFLLNPDLFAAEFDEFSDAKMHFHICNSNGESFLGTTNSDLPSDSFPNEMIIQSDTGRIWEYGGNFYLTRRLHNSWLFLSELASTDLMDKRRIVYLAIAAILISLLPAFLLSLYVSDRYTKDLSVVIDAMDSSETGGLEQITKQGRSREIRVLAASYNDMVNDVASLTADLRQEIEDKDHAEKKRQKLEAQLRQSQKLEAVGQLAGGVAHDFNNLLTALFGYVELCKFSLENDLPGNHEVFSNLDEIDNTAQRAASLTRQLLTFSRRDIIKPQLMDVNRTIENLQKMLSRLVTENITLTLKLSPGISPILADTGHMEQVLVNLVVNAVHAISGTGKIIIETSETTGKDGKSQVMLSVSDTGHGMDRETQEKIFEPFFTTKFRDKGTGLGLATVHGIVTQAEGRITVYSEPGLGTTFKLFFPAQQTGEKIEDTRNIRNEEIPLRGTEHIFLCEDDPEVKRLIVRSLRSAGYSVYSEENGLAALERIQSKGKDLDLIITDVIMPGINGHTLAERVSRSFPDLPILYISGYSSEIISQHGFLEEDIRLLEKPFSRTDLLRTVKKILS